MTGPGASIEWREPRKPKKAVHIRGRQSRRRRSPSGRCAISAPTSRAARAFPSKAGHPPTRGREDSLVQARSDAAIGHGPMVTSASATAGG